MDFLRHMSDNHYTPEQYRGFLAQLLTAKLTPARETIAVSQALGRINTEDIRASYPAPAFDNSQMDGYVLTAGASNRAKREFLVGHDIPAGFSGSVDIKDDIAYPIMTGAPIPTGYSAVVPVESSRVLTGETDAQGFAETGHTVELETTEPGTFVRTIGEDIQTGQVLIKAGTILTPAYIGVLAGQGISHLAVAPSPRLIIYTGGEEVTDTQGPLAPGKIYDANAPMLSALLASDGIRDVHTRHINDETSNFITQLENDCADLVPDLILTCGGISAGRYEVIRKSLTHLADNLGATSQYQAHSWFGHVRQQPGGPQGISILSTAERAIPLISLPGNPVSTLVSYTVLLRQALATAGVIPPQKIRSYQAKLESTEPVRGLEHKTQFRRGIAQLKSTEDGIELIARLHKGAGSHLLHAASEANVLIELEPAKHYAPREKVTVHLLPGASLNL